METNLNNAANLEITSETLNPKPAAKTRKPKTQKTDIQYTSVTGGTEYPIFKNSIPADLKSLFPELYETAVNLHKSGLTGGTRGIKFFFSFSPDITKPNKRVTNQFYISFTSPYKHEKNLNPAYLTGFNGKFKHQISGNKFFTLFPLIKNLFKTITARNGGNFILNISYASANSPAKRREHIISFNNGDNTIA